MFNEINDERWGDNPWKRFQSDHVSRRKQKYRYAIIS